MKKLIFLLIFLMPLAYAAEVTPADTPCEAYTTLYMEGSTLKITEFCLIRACLYENRSAPYYFKYSKDHKVKESITLTDYGSDAASFLWSSGVESTIKFNETKKVDTDKNGFYDQKVWYEITKPEVGQACIKIYELLESKAYKVPSANDLAYLNKTTTPTAAASANTTANNTALANTSESTANESSAPASETTASANETAEPAKTASQSGSETVVPGVVKSDTLVIEGEAKKDEEPAVASSKAKIIVGATIVVVILALILGLFFYIEKKRKANDFSVHINEDIGKVELGKKKD